MKKILLLSAMAFLGCVSCLKDDGVSLAGTTWITTENILGLDASVHFSNQYHCTVRISINQTETLSETCLYTHENQILTIILPDNQGSFLGKVSGRNMSLRVGDGSEWSMSITLIQQR